MPALQVRDFPTPLYEQLKNHAEKNHRSIAQQTIVAVEQMLSEEASQRGGSLDKQGLHPTHNSAIETPEELSERSRFRRQLLEYVATSLNMSQPPQKKKGVQSRKKAASHSNTLSILRETQSDRSAFFDWLDQGQKKPGKSKQEKAITRSHKNDSN